MSSRSTRSGKKVFHKTFTYFIPAPPHRKNGYREIEFDKILQGFIDSGFEISSLDTQSAVNGIFIVVLLKTTNKKIFELDKNLDLHDKFRLSHSHSSPDIILEEEEDV